MQLGLTWLTAHSLSSLQIKGNFYSFWGIPWLQRRVVSTLDLKKELWLAWGSTSDLVLTNELKEEVKGEDLLSRENRTKTNATVGRKFFSSLVPFSFGHCYEKIIPGIIGSVLQSQSNEFKDKRLIHYGRQVQTRMKLGPWQQCWATAETPEYTIWLLSAWENKFSSHWPSCLLLLLGRISRMMHFLMFFFPTLPNLTFLLFSISALLNYNRPQN